MPLAVIVGTLMNKCPISDLTSPVWATLQPPNLILRWHTTFMLLKRVLILPSYRGNNNANFRSLCRQKG